MASFVVPRPCVSPLRWEGNADQGKLWLLDQTLLPGQECWGSPASVQELVADITRLAVRGAPVLGVAGAYGLVLAAREVARACARTADPQRWRSALYERASLLAAARPTAVHLPAAVARGLAHVAQLEPTAWIGALFAAAERRVREEEASCAAIGLAGARWLGERRRFLTHCNAGALVSTGIGTALAPIYVLAASGFDVFVYADETRPLLQGLRLTAYELGRANIAHCVITDGAAGGLLRAGKVDAVLVGADAIARNGDVCNKVGTYPLALAARAAGVPFLVAAPWSTLNEALDDGDAVRIEDRPGDLGRYLVPGCLPGPAHGPAPAFDVTPAALVTALITEDGVIERPGQAAPLKAPRPR